MQQDHYCETSPPRFFRTFLGLILFILMLPRLEAQIRTEKIDIVRDQWGVPHIFAPSDAEVAYGLAWATAEDDFKTMQQQLLPVKGLNGIVNGKSGAIMDVAVHLMDAKRIVNERYETDLSPEFRKVLAGYAAGVNQYARLNRAEILHPKLFPVDGKDIIQAYVLGVALMAGVDTELSAILSGKLEARPGMEYRGSNAFAISKKLTKDGKTYLAINSHQPLEGPNSWYEAHLCSEEGWNILGSTFAGGVSIFHGANESLGWAHTVNYGDFADIYSLTMNPENEDEYLFDGKWEKLEDFHTKARIKVLRLFRLGVKQKFYQSKYGVTFKTDQGTFALRFPANRDIRAAEQWYRMNKAKDWNEFKKALDMRAISCTNIVYADKDDHLFYVSNGRMPKRNPSYQWKAVLPGDTSATLWADEYYPLDSLPHVLDPSSGYVYNCNHSPFLSSGIEDNPSTADVPITTGYQMPDELTNRGVVLGKKLATIEKIDYEEFKRIKFDRSYHKPLLSAPKLEAIFHLNPDTFPDLAGAIQLLTAWDRVADEESEAATLFILTLYRLRNTLTTNNSFAEGNELTEEKIADALRFSVNHLMKYFGSFKVALGRLQRHSRGEIDLPYGGGPDVLAAVGSMSMEDGRRRAIAGDSYIQLVRFSKNGPEMETVNAFGASAKPDSPHYTDQMEMFTQQKLKPMTLDKDLIYQQAEKIYHPQ